MTSKRTLTTGLSLLLLLIASASFAQTIPFEIELGYRSVSVDGNEDMYRTQINEEEGFLLRSFSLETAEFGDSTLIDRFRIDATDLGQGPASSLRLRAAKAGLYQFTLGYRELDVYTALPGFANPLVGSGIVPGQHTLDRTRTTLDAELELLPGGRFTPFIGYSWQKYDGPGTTTYHVGQDEFLLRSDLDETDNELRIGTGFNFGPVYGRLTQGWRDFSGDERLSLAPGAGGGNSPGSILDQPQTLDSFSRDSSTDVSTPFTNVFVTGAIANRVRLTGDYTRFAADGDGDESETLSGGLASFDLRRFFEGLDESVTSKAKNTTTRGGGRAEITLYEGVDLLAGYHSERRELEGTALVNSIYLDSITFGGADPRDFTEILNASSSLNRDEDTWNVGISARPAGPFTVRVLYSVTDQDVTVAPDLAEIVLAGGQSGDFSRQVKTWDAGASFSMAGMTLAGSYQKDEADDPILRVDFLNREQTRLRAGWGTPGNLFRAGVTWEETTQDNDRNGAGYDGTLQQYTVDAAIAPIDKLTLRGSYSKFEADSTVTIRLPQTFQTTTSLHEEDGEAIEAGLNLLLSPITLDAGWGQFQNRGTYPFDIDRYHVRLGVDLVKNTGLVGEWSHDKFEELDRSLGNFEADRYGIYLRWAP